MDYMYSVRRRSPIDGDCVFGQDRRRSPIDGGLGNRTVICAFSAYTQALSHELIPGRKKTEKTGNQILGVKMV